MLRWRAVAKLLKVPIVITDGVTISVHSGFAIIAETSCCNRRRRRHAAGQSFRFCDRPTSSVLACRARSFRCNAVRTPLRERRRKASTCRLSQPPRPTTWRGQPNPFSTQQHCARRTTSGDIEFLYAILTSTAALPTKARGAIFLWNPPWFLQLVGRCR